MEQIGVSESKLWNWLLKEKLQERDVWCRKMVGASDHTVWPPEEREARLLQDGDCAAEWLKWETEGINVERDALLLKKEVKMKLGWEKWNSCFIRMTSITAAGQVT